MIYNFNLGIGWASSGVEYAQIYRARMFRNIGVDAKFVFTDMFPSENMEHMTKNIGFLDSEGYIHSLRILKQHLLLIL